MRAKRTTMSNCEELRKSNADLWTWLRATEEQRDKARAEANRLRDALRHVIAKAEFHDTKKEIERILEDESD